MSAQGYDIIGDIHGHHHKLAALLALMGYQKRRHGFHHSEGRRVVFLGDYIDRGPDSRAVLWTVRAMVEAGDAHAIIGNHEYNAVCYHTPDGKGGWLRERTRDGAAVLATQANFAGREREWREWLAWMRRLPAFLDLGGMRAVHACWDEARIAYWRGIDLADDATLHACAQPGSEHCEAVDTTLKGPELDLPDGAVFLDKGGKARTRVRVRWWDIPRRGSVGQIAMPKAIDTEGEATAEELRKLPNYPAEAPPVFFGHYWLPAGQSPTPFRHNIACLDYSAAAPANPLVGYRWNGESVLDTNHFTSSAAD